jgi:hypothetical protein
MIVQTSPRIARRTYLFRDTRRTGISFSRHTLRAVSSPITALMWYLIDAAGKKFLRPRQRMKRCERERRLYVLAEHGFKAQWVRNIQLNPAVGLGFDTGLSPPYACYRSTQSQDRLHRLGLDDSMPHALDSVGSCSPVGYGQGSSVCYQRAAALIQHTGV